MIVILMGVSGSGKSTIGTLLANRTGALFVDADDHHPETNRTKMAGGQPLDDEDRQPWLEALNHLIKQWNSDGHSAVLACSALKRGYKATLTKGLPPDAVAFVWLDGSRDLISARLATRTHSFMSADLLDSQMATLEPPTDALRIVNDKPPEAIVSEILALLANRPNP